MSKHNPLLFSLFLAIFSGLVSVKMVLSNPIRFGHRFIAINGERAKPDLPKPDIFCNQFRKQDLNISGANFENQVMGNGLAPVVDGNHFRWGSKSIRFQVSPQTKSYTCPVIANPTWVTRSEFWFEGDRRIRYPNLIPFGQRRFTGFSFKIPINFTCPVSNSELIVMQWWQKSPSGPPLRFDIICNGRTPVLQMLRYDGVSVVVLLKYPIQRVEWYDVVLEYKLSKTSSGYVKIWLKSSASNRGYSTYNFPNISLGLTGKETGLFHKFGIYRPSANANPNTDILWFDEVRNGTTWNDVAPYPLPKNLYATIRSLGATSISGDKCLSPRSNTIGAVVNIVSCNSSSSQQNWSFEYQMNTGAYHIKNKALANSCLGLGAGSQIMLQSCRVGNVQQLWSVTKVRDVSTVDRNDLGFQIQRGAIGNPSNQCLNLEGLTVGSVVTTSTCNVSKLQKTALKSTSANASNVIDIKMKSLSRSAKAISNQQIWRFF